VPQIDPGPTGSAMSASTVWVPADTATAPSMVRMGMLRLSVAPLKRYP